MAADTAFITAALNRSFSSEVIPAMVVRILGGALKIRLSSPPVDGAANAELVRLLSKFFGVPKSAISVISGMSSRKKMVCVKGVTPESALRSAVEKLN